MTEMVSAFAAAKSSPNMLKVKKKKITKQDLLKDNKMSSSDYNKFENDFLNLSSILNKNKKDKRRNSSSNEKTIEILKKNSPSKKVKKGLTVKINVKSSKLIKTERLRGRPPTPKVPNKASKSNASSLKPDVEPLNLSGLKTNKSNSKKRPFEEDRQTKTSPSSKKKNNAPGQVEHTEQSPKFIPIRKALKMKLDKNEDSRSVGDETLAWMIQPHSVDHFFKNVFEEKPLYIPRKQNRNYYKDVLSTKQFDEMLQNQRIIFGKNLDVTTFVNDKRENHAPEGRAYPSVVWDFYNNGCSLRLLNPQTFNEKIWKLCATLQECLGSMVGANMYLTPPGTQGFAPHYDDVDVFILQLEGKKHWRVYEPPTKLPRFSSPNFSQSEMKEPIMDIVLEAGDLLYMPRGTIHQGNCLEDVHSLHITISCHQRNSFGDLFSKILNDTIETAMEEDVEFRKGLPRDYFKYAGAIHSDKDTPERNKFMQTMKKLFSKLHEYAPIDDGVDKMAKEFLHSTLPPFLSTNESRRTVECGGEKWNSGAGHVVNRVEFDPGTEIRLLRANCLRMVREEDSLRLYYNTENSREYQEIDSQFLEIEDDFAGAIDHLIESYPNYIKVEDLPLEDDALKFTLVQNMWEKKLILTKAPLESHYD
ncbi:ribosomal oxygenase 1 [Lepeophtheirus salmonis]|uniref:ribosomal oxygenase 1 n=1 Tax=Lepeophtheirus salmonis TaxID=72036 RepID=UPI001AE4FA1E|nr:ribosomal oxygenase 1-like isoform X1 [Lepeophtheirus salmonis]